MSNGSVPTRAQEQTDGKYGWSLSSENFPCVTETRQAENFAKILPLVADV